MKYISILNDVLGPIMRGPSSSHTAGSYRIGSLTRSLLGEDPSRVTVTVDPDGSLAPTLEQLGVDIAFVSGAMGWSMMDEDYTSAIEKAQSLGVQFDFEVGPLKHSNHPNAMWIEADSKFGNTLAGGAESIGGGSIRFTHIDSWSVELTGESFDVLVEANVSAAAEVERHLSETSLVDNLTHREQDDLVLIHARRTSPFDPELEALTRSVDGVSSVRYSEPFCRVKFQDGLFTSAVEMISAAETRGCSLGRIALAHEAKLLGMSDAEVLEEVFQRLEVMYASVDFGLDDHRSDMMLLKPTARSVLESEASGHVAIGGIQTRAAARALAVMHACNSRAVVCAAPTGGSAGVIPGVLSSLAEERGLEREAAAFALLAAGAVGSIVAGRATFAAETAGCQVEIGAAGAMAAAAVVEVAGGSALQATDAAAIALQNTMGSVCDPVQGTCEIPCHTRNAVAASSAFVCADLVLGGYQNTVPLDETIDASFAVGKTLPRELRCTAAGGLSITPSALSMERLR
ncbi:L-serine ammonia-lyase, iron-sulfur-dependent, subunit alpha [Gemmatimonadota bacterium]